MHIAELSARTGVAPRLLRYYEEQGLLEAARDHRGWRIYNDSHLARVREIRGLIESGLPTAAIAQLLDCATGDESTQVPYVSDELYADLVALRDRLDSRIRCLTRNRDALDGWLSAISSLGSGTTDVDEP